jgi:hypothetical protein
MNRCLGSFQVRCVLLAFLLLPLLLTAQSQKAEVTGNITDSSGALVPGVQVTVTNVGTDDKRTITSSETGLYTVPLLDPGKYEITARKEGFRTVTRSGIELHVNQTVRVDISLEVGALTESVQVTGAVAALQAETSDLGHVVENRQVLELPLNGRNTIALANLAAGVRPQGTFGNNSATGNYTGWGNFSANGGLANANEVLVDGLPATTAAIGGVAMMPAVDATEEFKVQTNNFEAEFDRTAGGIINLSLKSGTNAYHGSIYEFLRNDKFDAADFFTNRAGAHKPKLRYNQFGASAGGPIKRDKTFFFGSWESFRQGSAMVYTSTVPTALEQSGDFSRTLAASGALRSIYDPLTTQLVGSTYTRTPFAGNVLPLSRIDPVSAKLAKYLWPAGNTQGAAFTNVNNFGTSSMVTTNQDAYTAKIDHHFNANNRLSGSYTYMQPSLSFFDPLGNKTTPVDNGAEGAERSQSVNLNDSWVINSRTILDLRAGFLRFRDERIPASQGIDLTQFGFPKSYNDSVQWRSIPNIHVGGISDVNASTSSTIYGIQNNYSFAGSLSLIRGSHNMKMGAVYRVLQLNRTQNNNASGDFSFTAGFTQADPLTSSLTSGVPLASFLLGYPGSGSTQIVARLALQSKYGGWYFQDDWRVSRKLTLNVGFRYNLETFFTERFNHYARFDPDVVPVKAAQFSGLNLHGGMVFMTPGDRSPGQTYKKEFAPRFGLAYSLNSRTVIRGGYGIFWLPNNLSVTNGNGNNPAYAVSTPFNSSLDGGITPADHLSNPFPNGLLPIPGSAAGADTLIGQGFGMYGQGIHPGYMQQWNFDIQRDFGSGIAVDIAYAGSKGTKLPVSLAINRIADSIWMTQKVALNASVRNPFYGFVTTGALSGPTITLQQTLLPFPQFQGVSLAQWPIGNSTYHSMQLKATKRFASSGILTAAYTLSKALTDSESLTSWLETGGSNGGFYDPYNRRLDKALANFDSTHRLVVSYNYELPLGKGKALLGDVKGVAGKVISGWQVNGLTTLQTGYPLIPGRSMLVGDPNASTGYADRLYRWFNTTAFAVVPAYTWGTSPRTLPNTRSHKEVNFDFSVVKNTTVTERINLQFRSEFFNVLNHPWFARPDSGFGNPSYGTVNAVLNNPRLIQFGLKVLF